MNVCVTEKAHELAYSLVAAQQYSVAKKYC